MPGASGSWGDDEGGVIQWLSDTMYRIGNAVYDTAGNFLGWMEDVAGDATGAVQAKLTELRTAGARFTAAYAEFSAIGPEVLQTEYAAEWQNLKGRADMARNTLDGIATAAQSAYGWARSAFGLSGIRAGVQHASQLNGMGVVPVLTVGIVMGAVVLIVGLTTEMAQFIGNYNLVKQGLPPIYPPGGGTVGQISSTVKTIVIGGAIILLLPHVLKAFEGRR